MVQTDIMLITAGRMKNGKNQTSLLSLSLSLTLPLIFEQKNKRPATPGKTTHNSRSSSRGKTFFKVFVFVNFKLATEVNKMNVFKGFIETTILL